MSYTPTNFSPSKARLAASVMAATIIAARKCGKTRLVGVAHGIEPPENLPHVGLKQQLKELKRRRAKLSNG